MGWDEIKGIVKFKTNCEGVGGGGGVGGEGGNDEGGRGEGGRGGGGGVTTTQCCGKWREGKGGGGSYYMLNGESS
jgi:hypothetical protein